MKVLVCISNVPDTTSKITFNDDASALNTQGLQFVINPYDEIALAKAIDIANESSGSVTVIHVGPGSNDPIIRKALAAGADTAVRIDAEARDAWFVAGQIAHYVQEEKFDLILTGQESIDFNGSQLAAFLGELLQIPSVSIAKKLELGPEGNLQVSREIEGGTELIELSLPVVVGTAEGVAEPKIPNVRNIMMARSKPLEVRPAISVESLEEIGEFTSPAPRQQVKLAENVQQLVDMLHQEAKVI